MRRTYTPAALYARHPRLTMAALTIAGSGTSWCAWLGAKRQRRTAEFGSPRTAQRALFARL